PDVALLGLLAPDRGDGITTDGGSGRHGASHPHHGEQGRVRADGSLAIWPAIVRDGAAVSRARLGRGPFPQTLRAAAGLPCRYRLFRTPGLALPWPGPTAGVRGLIRPL